MSSKGILLDLDNTVYDYLTAHTPALETTLSWLTQHLDRSEPDVQSAYTESRRRVNKDLHGLASSHSRLLYFQGVCEQFAVSPYEIAVAAEDIYWQNFFEHMILRPCVLEFLQAMKGKPIAIVTDLTTKIQFQKITHLKLESYLAAIVTSEEAGHEKPAARIFEVAAAKLQITPQDLCMIGDSWERDIQGALKFGMPCYWFRDHTEKSNAAVKSDPVLSPDKERPALVHEFSDFSTLIELIDS